MQIVHCDDILHRLHTQFVSGAVNYSALHSRTRHPDAERGLVMIPAISIGSGSVWSAAKLGSPHQNRLVPQSATLQILDKSRHTLVGVQRIQRMMFPQRPMLVPRSVIAAVHLRRGHLDKAHAGFDQPLRTQALQPKCDLVLLVRIEPLPASPALPGS